MSSPLTLIGTPVSPFVRKIMAILDLKGVPFRVDPVVAFYTDAAFMKLNPLRRIPVLIEGGATIVDSSVIAAYLDETRADPPLLPGSPADRARARFLEEFADTRMADVFLWRCFNAVVLRPGVWGKERDLDGYKAALAGPVVEIMDWLEGEAPADGFMFGEFGLADISVAAMFRNMAYARWRPDAARWPKAAGWIMRAENHPAFARANAWADALIKVLPPQQREAARAAGVPLTDETFLRDGPPAPGPMTAASVA